MQHARPTARPDTLMKVKTLCLLMFLRQSLKLWINMMTSQQKKCGENRGRDGESVPGTRWWQASGRGFENPVNHFYYYERKHIKLEIH